MRIFIMIFLNRPKIQFGMKFSVKTFLNAQSTDIKQIFNLSCTPESLFPRWQQLQIMNQ